jgi:PAS domain S-box-containing protein
MVNTDTSDTGQVQIRSLTRRLQAQKQELERLRQRYRHLVQEAAAGVYEVDFLSGRLRTVNAVIEHYTAYSREELLNMPVENLLCDEGRPLYRERVSRMLRGEPVAPEVEYPIRSKDGRKFWIHLSNRFITENGRITGSHVVFCDITARKTAEAALRESEEKYRNLVEQARDGIVIIQENILAYVNPHFARMTGYAAEALVGRSAEMILTPELIRKLLPLYRRRMQGFDAPNICESKLRCSDGRDIDVELSIGAIPYRGRTAALTIVRDITERKNAERRLQFLSACLLQAQEVERNRLAKELHDELGQALALLKHRLRRRNDAADASRPETVEAVDRIIEDLRRISHRLRPAILEDLGLTAALKWAVDHFFQMHEAIVGDMQIADIDACIDLEAGINIYRIVQECLTNIARHAGADRVSVTVGRNADRVEIVVRDDGCGIDAARDRGNSADGAGMGMEIMAERARMIGADLAIRSRPGCGTRVRLRLPAAGRSNEIESFKS